MTVEKQPHTGYMLPPRDSEEYFSFASKMTGTSLRSMVKDPDSTITLNQLRRFVSRFFWFDRDPHRLNSFQLYDAIADGIRRGALIIAGDPFSFDGRSSIENWLVEEGDQGRLAWIDRIGNGNTIDKAHTRTSGRKFLRRGEKPEPKEDPPPPAREMKTTPAQLQEVTQPIEVGLQVVDDATGDPIPNVELTVTLPDKSEHTVKTDSSGLALLKANKPGNMKLTSPWQGKSMAQTARFVATGDAPSGQTEAENDADWTESIQCIAAITEYTPQKGDTLPIIAEQFDDLSDKDLAKFNWNTNDPYKLEDAMEAHGATEYAADGEQMFPAGVDLPVMVPGAWQQEGLHTGEKGLRTHTLRVAKVRVVGPALSIHYEFDIDAPESKNDTFSLETEDGSFSMTLKAGDLKEIAPNLVDLRFEGAPKDQPFRVYHEPNEEGQTKFVIFSNRTYDQLVGAYEELTYPEDDEQAG